MQRHRRVGFQVHHIVTAVGYGGQRELIRLGSLAGRSFHRQCNLGVHRAPVPVSVAQFQRRPTGGQRVYLGSVDRDELTARRNPERQILHAGVVGGRGDGRLVQLVGG